MAAVEVIAAPPQCDFSTLRQKLNRKSEFETTIQRCIRAVRDDPSVIELGEFRQVVRRVYIVLRTRYADTETAFWTAGLNLARAVSSIVAKLDQVYAQELSGYEQQCLATLATVPETESHQDPRPALFQGQLSVNEDPSNSNVQMMDMQSLATLLMGHIMSQSSTGEEAPRSQSMTQAAGEVPEGIQLEFERLQTELLEEMSAQAPARPPPPASKAVLHRLPKEVVTSERLAAAGDERCPVCMCLEEGDEVATLPCKHWAHAECLKPWLQSTNTCPTCRHELPTDDSDYERNKAREEEEKEARRGAENAVSHKEFLYI